MATTNSTILACDGLGTQPALSKLPCCHITDQDSPTCKRLFPATLKQGLLGKVCLGPDSTCPLFMNCSDVSSLYSSLEQTEQKGDGSWLIRRYAACANMPTIATAAYGGNLTTGISNVVTGYIPPFPKLKLSGFETKLQSITSAVTDCLSSTCRASRDVDFCYEDHCSPARLLRNGTLPNLEGINDCMWTLCNADERALPWPDADVIGIGVFISYMMQCALVVLLWAGLLFFAVKQHRSSKSRTRPESSSSFSSFKLQTQDELNPGTSERVSDRIESPHFDALLSLLLDFHKSQCYFAGTLMVASAITIFSARASGSGGIDIVITFLIIPLATNSILPVVFAYLLLIHFTPPKSHQRLGVSLPVTILTTTVYLFSSVIFWVLYSDLPLQSRPGSSTEAGRVDDANDMYRLYRLQLSSLPACGGYSGLAVCPFESRQRATAVEEGLDARRKLRVLTPIIWGWSTFVLLGCLWWQLCGTSKTIRRVVSLWKFRSAAKSPFVEKRVNHKESRSEKIIPSVYGSRWWTAGFWLTTMVFLAGVGMQLAVLWTAKLLGMVNDSDWGFGQIVAVTIWIPPLLEYLFEEIELLAGTITDKRGFNALVHSERNSERVIAPDSAERTALEGGEETDGRASQSLLGGTRRNGRDINHTWPMS
ncbi:hypothetical protein V8F20_012239 [Naviculisporaceae sp. PSN 640]